MVQNVERVLGRIRVIRFYFKKEPLDVALSVSVVLQNQVVLCLMDFNRSCQITRLKPTVEVKTIVRLVDQSYLFKFIDRFELRVFLGLGGFLNQVCYVD